jgi:hypothetical protein
VVVKVNVNMNEQISKKNAGVKPCQLGLIGWEPF